MTTSTIAGTNGGSADPSGSGAGEIVVRSPLAVQALAALWAIVLGLLVVGVPTIVGWALAAGPSSSIGEAARVGTHIWLAAHLVPSTSSAGALGVLPLGLLVIPTVLLALATRYVTRLQKPTSVGGVLRLVGGIALPYAAVVVLIGALAGSDALRPRPFALVLAPVLVALVVCSVTAGRVSGATAQLASRARPEVRAAWAGAGVAVLTMIAGGAVLAAGALLVRLDDATTVAEQLQPGVVGGILLTIVGIAYTLTAAIWGAAFAVGPGFSVGAGTVVTPGAAATDAVPSFPLLAALPADGPGSAWSVLALLLPLVAGVLAGFVVARRAAGHAAPETAAVVGAVAGALGGVLLGLLAALSGGALGDGRLDTVGPSGWRVGLLAAMSLATVAAATAWVAARRHASRGVPRVERSAAVIDLTGDDAFGPGRPVVDLTDAATVDLADAVRAVRATVGHDPSV